MDSGGFGPRLSQRRRAATFLNAGLTSGGMVLIVTWVPRVKCMRPGVKAPPVLPGNEDNWESGQSVTTFERASMYRYLTLQELRLRVRLEPDNVELWKEYARKLELRLSKVDV